MNVYIIERRYEDGKLDLAEPQPEKAFGMRAITGISEDEMAKIVFAKCPDAKLHGTNIPAWPSFIDPRWIARRKTW